LGFVFGFVLAVYLFVFIFEADVEVFQFVGYDFFGLVL